MKRPCGLGVPMHESLERGGVGGVDHLALTLLVLRSLMPTTGVLPMVPRPVFSFLLECLFRSLPPKYVSSTSTGPSIRSSSSSHISRIRWARCQADGCRISRSRCNFMLATPFRFVTYR